MFFFKRSFFFLIQLDKDFIRRPADMFLFAAAWLTCTLANVRESHVFIRITVHSYKCVPLIIKFKELTKRLCHRCCVLSVPPNCWGAGGGGAGKICHDLLVLLPGNLYYLL